MEKIKQTFLLSIAAAAAAHLIVSYCSEQSKASAPTASITTSTPAISSTVPIGDPKSALPVPKLAGHKRLDLAFCIDTTGSMQAEIDTVKRKVKSVVQQLTKSNPNADVRIGVVAYRDEGDEYVTKVFQFDNNVDKVVKSISDLNADGGGDGPEAVQAGLHSALHELTWNESRDASKVLFLIGDAPAHEEYVSACAQEAKDASKRGIRINAITCDGFDGADGGAQSFKQVASLTNGTFQHLAYEQEVADASGKKVTVISEGTALYKVKEGAKVDWKEGGSKLAEKGSVELVAADMSAPHLQGATNGTIGPQGADATIISGVNTAGTVRMTNNLDSMILDGANQVLNGK